MQSFTFLSYSFQTFNSYLTQSFYFIHHLFSFYFILFWFVYWLISFSFNHSFLIYDEMNIFIYKLTFLKSFLCSMWGYLLFCQIFIGLFQIANFTHERSFWRKIIEEISALLNVETNHQINIKFKALHLDSWYFDSFLRILHQAQYDNFICGQNLHFLQSVFQVPWVLRMVKDRQKYDMSVTSFYMNIWNQVVKQYVVILIERSRQSWILYHSGNL